MIPADATGFTDTGRAPETTYDYRLRAINGAGPSGYSNVVQAVTGAAPNITLSANGSKDKGVQQADLTWNGADGVNVLIMRDGNVITTTSNDGAYHDNIGNRGRGNYPYQVCETADPSICSNAVQVSF